MNYLAHLIRSKGLGQLGQRGVVLLRRYGVTPGKMAQAIDRLIDVLERYDCQATFPVTAAALARHPGPIRRSQERGIELAVHGWTHVDLERYSAEQQREHLSRALQLFDRHGISAVGFRSPYLRRDGTIHKVVEAAGFRYVSNQPILWDASGVLDQPTERFRIYQRAIDFYTPWSSVEHVSLPAVQGRIIEIPVSLPDDEMLVERLGASSIEIAQIWTQILRQTYARGELFTIQLHPERAAICIPALTHVLSEARSYKPPVWIARLDKVAEWWQQRAVLRADVVCEGPGQYGVAIQGPPEVSALVRSAQVIGKSEVWENGYCLVRSQRFSVQSASRPVIGVSTRTSPALVCFLEQQGYIVDVSEGHAECSIYFDQSDFGDKDKKSLVEKIESAGSPLICINRWPGGARSALAITGDIDALTLWDYGLRLVRK